MEQKSMTALVSAFARWYHTKHNNVKIFDDSFAEKLLTEDEKRLLSINMSNGISFFNPMFNGKKEEALRWIVDNQLSPSPLGRAVWAEKALQTAVKAGATQYLIIAAGYDTFSYRQPAWAANLQIYELDHPILSEEKRVRVLKILNDYPNNLTYIPINFTNESFYEKMYLCNNYENNKLSFCSLLGISYYISKDNFRRLLQNITNTVSKGSTVVFDYPDEHTYTEQAGERAKKQIVIANGAGEAMLASYSYKDIEQLLSDCDFLIYEHLKPDEITKQYFENYNKQNPNHLITAFDNVNYCLAVKRTEIT